MHALLLLALAAARPGLQRSSRVLSGADVDAHRRRGWRHSVIVKFADPLLARCTAKSASIHSLSGNHSAELLVASALAGTGATLAPALAPIPPDRIEALEARARRRTHHSQPDLEGMCKVVAPQARLRAAARALMPLVAEGVAEFVHHGPEMLPPPAAVTCEPPSANATASTNTPNFVPLQTYRQADPGMDADRAERLGADGSGVRLSDCEYCWIYDHEDVFPLHAEPGYDCVDYWSDDHGIASVGVAKGVDNGFGVTGIARRAAVHTYGEMTEQEGYNRERAVAAAVADSQPGDVVLLEMQYAYRGDNYAPAETHPAVWLLTRTAADAGVVVVGGAGNGDEDLDGPFYDEYRSRGDSGAVIVGAGTAAAAHERMEYSGYGSRVDVQGWGEGVATAGWSPPNPAGGCHFEGGDQRNRRYTASYAGTSSASALVGAAAAAIQSAALKSGGPLDPDSLRALMVRTGVPQGGTVAGSIGPHVNVGNAVEELLRSRRAA
eukprot:TRINITY_DN39185_c0_g1_i1.p2 TRINITY_DN39185_c0_g1~~TRINITY_DN39185_c0_g1_i1.p2  ORF type:complete len:514 (+),score=169.56 TRINITY_DN39185_c0_g1_i1:58-1542(+)